MGWEPPFRTFPPAGWSRALYALKALPAVGRTLDAAALNPVCRYWFSGAEVLEVFQRDSESLNGGCGGGKRFAQRAGE